MTIDTKSFPKPGIYNTVIIDGVLVAKFREPGGYHEQGIRLEGPDGIFECSEYIPGIPSVFADCDGDEDPRLPCSHCVNKKGQ
jgi:hypothetical protein